MSENDKRIDDLRDYMSERFNTLENIIANSYKINNDRITALESVEACSNCKNESEFRVKFKTQWTLIMALWLVVGVTIGYIIKKSADVISTAEAKSEQQKHSTHQSDSTGYPFYNGGMSQWPN